MEKLTLPNLTHAEAYNKPRYNVRRTIDNYKEDNEKGRKRL
jgi:hypothetical protein